MRKFSCHLLLFVFAFAIIPSWTQEQVDLEMVNRIRYEGFRNSKVMDLASGLMDGIGPRLTGSPNAKKANEWTRNQLASFGLTNAHLEAWGPFGHTKIDLFSEGPVCSIAATYGVTPAQVLLRWYLQHGWPVVGKTENSEHLKENWDIFGFELADGDMASLDAMNRDQRVGPDPDLVDSLRVRRRGVAARALAA